MTTQTDPREEFAGRLFMAGLAAFELATVYIGDKLGLYRALREGGAATSAQLADRAGINERYAREWLEQQAAASLLLVDDPSKPAEQRAFSISEEAAACLTDLESPYSVSPLAGFLPSIGLVMPQLLTAFQNGGGVPWSDFGTDVIEAQGNFNRPWLLAQFGTEYLPSIADVHARLSDATTPARIADVACGAGWASIAIAKAYPLVTVDGFDLDEQSIAIARKNAAEAGVADRVSFEVRDAANAEHKGRYDVAIVIEAIHDLSNPVGVLSAIREMLVPGGVALVADERVADVFTAPGDETERFMYAVSVLCCLPAGMADDPSAATGTVMRASTMARYATDAGFASTTVVDSIEHPMLRFYRLD